MRIALFWADKWSEWISSMWRIQFLHAGLLGANIESRLYGARELNPHSQERYHPVEDWADIIIFERLNIDYWMDYVKRWLDKGIKVFMTLDDAYHLMPDYMKPPTKLWSDPSIVKQFRKNLRIFDGVFVPSPGLADELTRFGAKVYHIKNYPDLNHPAIQYALNGRVNRYDNNYVIGWGGSHHHSLVHIVPVLEELVEEWPMLQIWIVGNNAAFDALENIPPHRKRQFPRMPYGLYLTTIKQFDVFAIPLEGRYDQCRSWVKPLEAALMGVPWVATDDRIYKDCQGGRLVRGQAQWKEALMSPEIAATEWALEQGISDHIQEYINVLLGDNSNLWRRGRRSHRRRAKKRKG